jgi:hypothetical protein
VTTVLVRQGKYAKAQLAGNPAPDIILDSIGALTGGEIARAMAGPFTTNVTRNSESFTPPAARKSASR